MSANPDSQLSSFIDSSVIQGRLPFSKNSGLKFQKFHAPKGTVHFDCTDPTQAAARSVIVLVSRRQKIDNGNNNFVKWKGTFRSNRPKWPYWSKWTTLKAGSEYCGQTMQTEVAGILAWMESAPRGRKWLQFRRDSFVSLSFCPKGTKKLHKWLLILLQMLIRKIVFDEELFEKITRTFGPSKMASFK